MNSNEPLRQGLNGERKSLNHSKIRSKFVPLPIPAWRIPNFENVSRFENLDYAILSTEWWQNPFQTIERVWQEDSNSNTPPARPMSMPLSWPSQIQKGLCLYVASSRPSDKLPSPLLPRRGCTTKKRVHQKLPFGMVSIRYVSQIEKRAT